jgi:hypothetical protein
VSPACVVHWPKLHGDGDYGTRFGPSELSKAKYSACTTDEDLPSGPNEQMRLWFAVVKAIDCKLAQFAHAQQTELFKPRGLSFEAVEAKLCAAVMTKEFNGRAHEQQTLATRRRSLSLASAFSRRLSRRPLPPRGVFAPIARTRSSSEI